MRRKSFENDSSNVSKEFRVIKIYKKTIERETVCRNILEQLYCQNILNINFQIEQSKKEK